MIGFHITVFTTIITLMENNMDGMEFSPIGLFDPFMSKIKYE